MPTRGIYSNVTLLYLIIRKQLVTADKKPAVQSVHVRIFLLLLLAVVTC